MLVKAIGVFFEARVETTCTFCSSTALRVSTGWAVSAVSPFTGLAYTLATHISVAIHKVFLIL